MLGLLGIVVLALGVFAAGGGVFDWEILFADGYREYGWVRSLGRDGARGLLILLGGVCVVLGFVSQVVDCAAGPVAAMTDPATDESTATGATEKTPVQSPSAAGPATNEVKPPPASFSSGPVNPAPPLAPPGPQPVTIWAPAAVMQDNDLLVEIQYRFEAGHSPLPGSRYFWVIDMLGVTHEVEYDAETLQRQGQLSHIIRLPPEKRDSKSSWSSMLMAETSGHRRQASNRLEITPGEGVRSAPIPAP